MQTHTSSTPLPGFCNNHAANTSYKEQCLTYGFAGAAAALFETITLDKDNIWKWAILDSGATSSFLMMDTHATNLNNNAEKINVTLPDGNNVQSTHQYLLNLPDLLPTSRLLSDPVRPPFHCCCFRLYTVIIIRLSCRIGSLLRFYSVFENGQ